MSSGLTTRLINRIRRIESDTINAEGARRAAAVEAQEATVSDLGILQQRARVLGGRMVALHLDRMNRQGGRGRKQSKKRSEPLIDCTLTTRDHLLGRSMYEHLTTPLLQPREKFVEGHVIINGLRARLERHKLTNDHYYIHGYEEWSEKFFSDGLYIEQVEQHKEAPELTEAEPLYRVGLEIPRIESYTGGVLDDPYITIEKQAGVHALALVNQITELLN